jgi:hypothetical protein
MKNVPLAMTVVILNGLFVAFATYSAYRVSLGNDFGQAGD